MSQSVKTRVAAAGITGLAVLSFAVLSDWLARRVSRPARTPGAPSSRRMMIDP